MAAQLRGRARRLYPELPISRVVRSDVAHAVALALVAVLGRLWLHRIDFDMLEARLAGSILGIVIGSLLVSPGGCPQWRVQRHHQ